MKRKCIKRITFTALLFTLLIFTSCYQPSPLTGTWADNKGNQITLLADYTYNAKIKNYYGDMKVYSGSYNVMLNAITFTSSDGYQMVSEWDVRGSMLYLLWSDSEGKPLQLTLYKTKN